MKKFADVVKVENGYLVIYAVAQSRKRNMPGQMIRALNVYASSPGQEPEDVEQWVVCVAADFCKTREEILVAVVKADGESVEIDRLVKDGKLQPGPFGQTRPYTQYIQQEQF